MGGQLAGNFLRGSLPHKFILIVILIICFVVNKFLSPCQYRNEVEVSTRSVVAHALLSTVTDVRRHRCVHSVDTDANGQNADYIRSPYACVLCCCPHCYSSSLGSAHRVICNADIVATFTVPIGEVGHQKLTPKVKFPWISFREKLRYSCRSTIFVSECGVESWAWPLAFWRKKTC